MEGKWTLWLTFLFQFFFQNWKCCVELERGGWKVWNYKQYLQCLVKNIYKLAFYIVVVHEQGPLSIREVLGTWVVYGRGPLRACSMSPELVPFLRFMVHNDPCFAHSPNIIGCTVWGIGAFDRLEFCQIFVSLTCVLWFLKMTHQEAFSVIQIPFSSFVVSVVFKRH